MVNVNIPITGELHKQLKLKALLEDKTLKDYIIDALREEVLCKEVLRKEVHK